MWPLEPVGEARYRTIDEARIVEMLMVHVWRFEVAAGHRSQAFEAGAALLERYVALGLPFRGEGAAGARRFDPVEVLNFLKWAHVRHGDPAWDRCIADSRRQAWGDMPDQARSDAPPPLEALGAQRFAVIIRRSFNLSGRRPGERVRLRLPLPIEDAAQRDLAIEFLPPAGASTQTVIAPARMDVLVAVPEVGRVSLGVRAAFTADPSAPGVTRLDPAEAALYRRPSEGLIKVTDRIVRLAAELAGEEREALALMRRFWTFALDGFGCGAIHHDALDPARPLDWVLDHGWYDCQAGSALLAALCRARGVPARLVSGYMLHEVTPGFHTWMEAWIEGMGWRAFDLDSWELSRGGRDAAWRDSYFGRLDHRMVTERPPLLFSGPGAVRLPPAWHLLVSQTDRGLAQEFEDLATGAPVYREDVEVERLDV